jgi:periplasmic divalent cation tolerance protein
MKKPAIVAILVMTHLPDRDSAKRIANFLIEQRLAACVQLMPPCTSIYHWQGQIETASEIPLQIKTSLASYEAVEAAIQRLHPYELPDITYVNIDGGEAAYIQWIEQESRN